MTTKKVTTKKAIKKVPPVKEASKAVSVLAADVYTKEGKKKGSVELPGALFGLPWNGSLVQQVVIGMQANARTPVAHTKTRGEVRGGGKKPWKQKGTGRARHGSTRSPIWVGGGVAHGPRNDKDYSKKINKKMRVKALYTVLSRKVKDGEVIFIDSLDFATPKSAQAKEILASLAGIKGFERIQSKKVNAALVVLGSKDMSAEKSFQNFGNVDVVEARNLNPVSVLGHSYLVVVNPDEAIAALASRA